MKKLSNLEYLLLDYLWCSPEVTLGFFLSKGGIEDQATMSIHYHATWVYHGLEIPELTKVLSKLIREGMFLLTHNRPGCLSYFPVYLDERRLRYYFEVTAETQNSCEPNYEWIIYIKLSEQGTKAWEKGIKPNWNKFHIRINLEANIWNKQYQEADQDTHPLNEPRPDQNTWYAMIQSPNQKHLSQVERFYLDYAPVANPLEIDRKVFSPWCATRVYWKQFAKGFMSSIPLVLSEDAQGWLPEPYTSVYVGWEKLSSWRREWLLDKDRGLILLEPI